MTPLTDEQIETRLQVLATGRGLIKAAGLLGITESGLRRWVRINGLQKQLSAHRSTMRSAYWSGMVSPEDFTRVF